VANSPLLAVALLLLAGCVAPPASTPTSTSTSVAPATGHLQVVTQHQDWGAQAVVGSFAGTGQPELTLEGNVTGLVVVATWNATLDPTATHLSLVVGGQEVAGVDGPSPLRLEAAGPFHESQGELDVFPADPPQGTAAVQVHYTLTATLFHDLPFDPTSVR